MRNRIINSRGWRLGKSTDYLEKSILPKIHERKEIYQNWILRNWITKTIQSIGYECSEILIQKFNLKTQITVLICNQEEKFKKLIQTQFQKEIKNILKDSQFHQEKWFILYNLNQINNNFIINWSQIIESWKRKHFDKSYQNLNLEENYQRLSFFNLTERIQIIKSTLEKILGLTIHIQFELIQNPIWNESLLIKICIKWLQNEINFQSRKIKYIFSSLDLSEISNIWQKTCANWNYTPLTTTNFKEFQINQENIKKQITNYFLNQNQTSNQLEFFNIPIYSILIYKSLTVYNQIKIHELQNKINGLSVIIKGRINKNNLQASKTYFTQGTLIRKKVIKNLSSYQYQIPRKIGYLGIQLTLS